ncbi:MAG TPA: hypothetical protein VN203_05840, partial [Candidatus Acidoferrum sp.]|nr:hypothetical protein [Candidatus Acidoferrum sp.]
MRVDNDQVSSGIWVILGLIISLGSLQYGLGSLESPGTGFMPFLAGLAITLLSLIGFSQGVFKRRERSWKPILRGVDWPKTAIVVGALFG